MTTPRLAITMGDPAGIGPETIVRAWSDERLHLLTRPVVVGSVAVLERAAERFAPEIHVTATSGPEAIEPSRSVLPCIDCADANAADVPPATVDPRGGQAAYESLCAAAHLALKEQVDGIVTAPLHKAALHAAGHEYPGHTELLADLCGVNDFAMMLYVPSGDGIGGSAGLGVAHVTLHMALRDVFRHLTIDAIVAKARLADRVMRRMLGEEETQRAPRIGVCALNPHAGEQGLFGDEELTTIAPAVELAQAAGLDAYGPLPTDTLMVRAAQGEFDAVVAMYHDQGHIALKLLGMHRAVNITLGLPIVRTSVAHGTAFDLAWQGVARYDSLIEAIRVAAKLAKRI